MRRRALRPRPRPPAPPAWRALRRAEAGTSAVEFALVAPVLVAGLMGMVDLGFAFERRMDMDGALRALAQRAMQDPGLATLRDSASRLAQEAPYTLTVTAMCACVGEANCTEPCADPADLVGYRIAATANYDSLVTPASFDLSSTVEVQVR